MTYTKSTFQEFIASLEGFEQLPTAVIAGLSEKLQVWRQRTGRKIISQEQLP